MPNCLRGNPLSIVRSWFVVPILLSVLLFAAPLRAQPYDIAAPAEYLWLAAVDGAGAARIVERNTGGKVLGIQRQEKKGKTVYRVKVLLPEGRVRTVTVDAETGQMSG